MKFHFKWQQVRNSKNTGVFQGGEIYSTHCNCQQIPDYQAKQNGKLLPVGLRKDMEQNAAKQGYTA